MSRLIKQSTQTSTPLHLAVREPEKLRKLISNELPGFLNKECYQCTNDGQVGLLHCAVLAGNIETTGILLDAGANINEQDSMGKTPLMQACTEGNMELAMFLVENGADVNILDNDGQNCAHCAFCMEHLDLGTWLIDETDVDATAVDADGRTPIDWRNLYEMDDDEVLEEKVSGLQIEEKEDCLETSSTYGGDEAADLEERKLADAKKESQAFVINGEKNNFAAGGGLRAIAMLRKSDNGILCCDM